MTQLHLFHDTDTAYSPAHPITPVLTARELEIQRQRQKEYDAYDRLKEKMPLYMRVDGWDISKVPKGYWEGVRFYASHLPSGLKTERLASAYAAVDRAITIAAFFDILPDDRIEQYWANHGDPFRHLPYHLQYIYKYGSTFDICQIRADYVERRRQRAES